MSNVTQRPGNPITVLVADDDEDDRGFARDALDASAGIRGTEFVADGQELLDYLRHAGRYATAPAGERPEPSIILLDLNMPRKDGREALAEIKADERLRHIPVVVLTISGDERDVRLAYDLGASSYITKPVTGGGLERALGCLADYWARIVTLPDADN